MRRISFFLLTISFFFFANCRGGNSDTTQHAVSGQSKIHKGTTTICNWNIEWFGSTKKGPYDLDAQEMNATKILTYIHADLFGLCEIVDVKRLDNMVKVLGNNYQYLVSDYCSNATSPNTQSWREGQKMAFVYNAAIFKNVKARGFMQKSRRAGHNFSNGRYPYLFEAQIVQNAKTIPIAILLVHAKSGSDQESYNRRQEAASEMADSIQIALAGKPLLLMGDFNDILQGSISGNSLESPYASLMTNGYNALTLPMEIQHQTSTIHYRNVIDNQIANALLGKYYVKGSTAIRTDVVNPVSDYKKGKTSDHYPVISAFDFGLKSGIEAESPKTDNPLPPVSETKVINSADFVHIVTPSFQDAIEIKVSQKQENLQFVLYNSSNEKVLSVHRRYIDPNKSFFLKCKELTSGNYTLVVYSGNIKNVFQVVKN